MADPIEKLEAKIKDQEVIIQKKNDQINQIYIPLLNAGKSEEEIEKNKHIMKLNAQMEEAEMKKLRLESELADKQGNTDLKDELETKLNNMKRKAVEAQLDSLKLADSPKQKLELFFSELMDGNLDGDLWEFSDSTIDEDFPPKLWIRPEVFAKYCQYVLSGWTLGRNWVYLSGSPGAGKTSFGLYFLVYLLKNSHADEIVYWRGGRYYLLSLAAFVSGFDEKMAMDKFDNPRVIGVFDSPPFQPPTNGVAKRLLISSPKCNDSGQSFYKEIVGERGAVRLFFPRLSKEEAIQMLEKVPPLVNISVDDVEKTVGLIPRPFYMMTFIENQTEKRQSSKTKYLEFLKNCAAGVDAAPHCIISIDAILEKKFLGLELPTGYMLDFSCEDAKHCVLGWNLDSNEDLERIKRDAFNPLSRSAGVSFEI
eukprot:TRINITY_DN6283_c0_g1_i5.p1 TRINITY_DN6283_c0_g1~~TRINITY_DN6283_c0_g1_i5.p1  ORF type:complete len:423 (-),score=91.68 TRINITY_DN6283_c0_g1_i5:2798-4066(-)